MLVTFALFDSWLPQTVAGAMVWIARWALVGMVLGVVLSLLGPRFLRTQDSVGVCAPVQGRWLALNSPATKVPSHGIRAYGQTYAIDLVYEPPGEARPIFGTGPAMRPPRHYPAFGQPVYSMVSGTVVRASSWHRDHRSRSRMLAVIYMMLEGAFRELGGPGFILGNHVVIRSHDGFYAVIAHLQ